MLVWLFMLVAVLLVTPVLFVLVGQAKHLTRQQRQGFARRPAPDPTAVDTPAPPTRNKPDWVVQEILRLKALVGKNAGCRKVADTFNRIHAPARVGKSFVSDTIRSHQFLNLTRLIPLGFVPKQRVHRGPKYIKFKGWSVKLRKVGAQATRFKPSLIES